MSCVDFCVARIQAIILDYTPHSGVAARIRELPQELAEKICNNRRTCQLLCLLNHEGISVHKLVLTAWDYFAPRTFHNVVSLDIASAVCRVEGVVVRSWTDVTMPSVKKLKLRCFLEVDEEWRRVSASFENLESLALVSEENAFTFTTSWMSGVAFPNIVRLKVQASHIYLDETEPPRARSLVDISLVWTSKSEGLNENSQACLLYKLLDPTSIRFLFLPALVHVDEKWWISIRTLVSFKICIIPTLTNVLSLLRHSQEERLGTKLVSVVMMPGVCGPVREDSTMSEFLDFVRQEKESLIRIGICVLSPMTRRDAYFELAKQIFASNSKLQIIHTLICDQHIKRVSCLVIFLATPENITWVRKKVVKHDDFTFFQFYVASASREIQLLSTESFFLLVRKAELGTLNE